MSPYRNPSDVRILLQDFDEVTGSTLSTSILSTADMVGKPKTRAMAKLLDQRSFRTTVLERRFDGAIRRKPDDPAVLICCVDNVKAGKAIERPGFPLVLEAGIGRRKDDYRSLRFHSFPAVRKAQDIWAKENLLVNDTIISQRYATLLSQGVEQCGRARLANTAVGAPFVGAVAGSVVYSQLMRMIHGWSAHSAIDLDLLAVQNRRMIFNQVVKPMNLGFAGPMDPSEQAA